MLEFAFDLGPLHFRFTLADQATDEDRESTADALVERAPDWRHPDNELDARPAPLGFRA